MSETYLSLNMCFLQDSFKEMVAILNDDVAKLRAQVCSSIDLSNPLDGFNLNWFVDLQALYMANLICWVERSLTIAFSYLRFYKICRNLVRLFSLLHAHPNFWSQAVQRKSLYFLLIWKLKPKLGRCWNWSNPGIMLSKKINSWWKTPLVCSCKLRILRVSPLLPHQMNLRR